MKSGHKCFINAVEMLNPKCDLTEQVIFRHDNITSLAGGKTKQKLEAAYSTQRRFFCTRSLKYHLVVMLGARIVVEAPILNCNAYLLPLPDTKSTTAVVKRDKTSRLDKNYSKKGSHLQRTLLIKKG